MQEKIFYITEEQVKERVDKCLAELEETLSRSFLQKLIKDGKVLVNGVCVKARYEVNLGDKIVLQLPDLEEPKALPENIPLDILYEDADLIVVNKPKGMIVHPAAGHNSGTLVNALLFHCGNELSGINGVMRPGIVHRIDRDTTGVLVICKNDQAHNCLAEQLKVHSITRKYCAIVHGEIREEEGVVDAAIGRHPVDRKKMTVFSNGAQKGRSAVTHYRVLARGHGYSYVECQLETGRTHQIRVHMASIHHPILGDRVYGPERCPFADLEGQTLHARVLGFLHPSSGIYVEFEAPIPDYFLKLLRRLELQ